MTVPVIETPQPHDSEAYRLRLGLERTPERGGAMVDFSTHAQFVVGLFAMMDPIAAVPLMLVMTQGFTARQRRQTAFAATVAVIVILLGAQYSGVWLLDMLGTSLASLEIAGGIVIAWTGFSMLTSSGMEDSPLFGGGPGASPVQLGIVPLALPLLAGPGAITKVLLEAQDNHGLEEPLHISFYIVAICIACGLLLVFGSVLGRLVGKVGMIIFNRLFGLIVIAIGVEILVEGIAKHMVVALP